MAVIRLHVGARLSEAAIHNGTVYLAGQIAEDTDQDITGQTREVLGHIDRLLVEAGSDKTQLLSVQIYISDMVTLPSDLFHRRPPSQATDEAWKTELAREAEMISEALSDAAGERLVSLEAVKAWVDSWDTDHELPPPTAPNN